MIDAAPRAALATAAESFAACRADIHIKDVAFAGRHLRLEVVGAALHEVVSAAFAAAPPGTPDLVIRAWDGTSAPLSPPEPGRTAPIRVGEHFAVDDEGRHVFWEPPWIYGFDPGAQTAFFHCPDARELPSWTRSQPFLRLLHAWLRQTEGADLVHGAVIGRGDVGLLLVGPGGSGKSTLAVAAALAGWSYLGDDYVAVRDGVAFGLYTIAKLVPAHLAAHVPAADAHRLGPVEGPKALLRIPLSRTSLRLGAILVPELAPDGHDALAPTGPGRALRALAPSTLLQLPAGPVTDRLAFGRLAALTRALPAWSLRLGRDTAATLALVERELPNLTGQTT